MLVSQNTIEIGTCVILIHSWVDIIFVHMMLHFKGNTGSEILHAYSTGRRGPGVKCHNMTIEDTDTVFCWIKGPA